MNLLLYMAPVAVVILLPATLLMEDNVVGITVALARKDVNIVWYLLFNSALAYLVNLTNFLVTKHTSALTLQVFPTCFFLLYLLSILILINAKLWFLCMLVVILSFYNFPGCHEVVDNPVSMLKIIDRLISVSLEIY